MIDWQVQIGGHDPPGWDRKRDGGRFPDFDHQEYLLPYFDVGDALIDPYGGTDFNEADLRRLKAHLLSSYGVFEARPDAWTVTEASADQTTVLRLKREKILAVIDRTLEMIEFALANAGTIRFYGD